MTQRIQGRVQRRRPGIGRGTPVVVGRDRGRPRRLRTARKPNACASSASPAQPTASTGSTGTPERCPQARHQRRVVPAAAGHQPAARRCRQVAQRGGDAADRERRQRRRTVLERQPPDRRQARRHCGRATSAPDARNRDGPSAAASDRRVDPAGGREPPVRVEQPAGVPPHPVVDQRIARPGVEGEDRPRRR